MSTTTTYSPAYGATAGPAAATSKRKGLLRRFADRMVEARMRKADEFIRQHAHLIPRELEETAGWKLTERSEDSLPFVR
jgi:hypothetical protein